MPGCDYKTARIQNILTRSEGGITKNEFVGKKEFHNEARIGQELNAADLHNPDPAPILDPMELRNPDPAPMDD